MDVKHFLWMRSEIISEFDVVRIVVNENKIFKMML